MNNEVSLEGTPIKNMQISNPTMNSVVKNGFYTIVNVASDGPGFSPFGLIVFGNNSNYCVQIACAFRSPNVRIRRNDAGVWSAWNSFTIT